MSSLADFIKGNIECVLDTLFCVIHHQGDEARDTVYFPGPREDQQNSSRAGHTPRPPQTLATWNEPGFAMIPSFVVRVFVLLCLFFRDLLVVPLKKKFLNCRGLVWAWDPGY